jgi:TolB-like protein/tetratricopeptide (TPR) repeat protein
MGVVYRAFDDQLDRPTAIKIVGMDSSNEIARQRLQREGRSAARIRHPNVCQIYDIGEHHGEPFIAMELLDGEPLSERLVRGALPIAEAVPLALLILGALQALHDHGIVHRDLKPSNVFLTGHGPKLLDFGLARAAEAGNATDRTEAPLTLVGSVVGTPEYMSPEQFRGEAADARSDLFSAGVMLFEMLAGKRPFAGRTGVDVYHAIMSGRPPAMGGSPAAAIVDSVIRRALARDRLDRVQTAAEMAERLRPALAVQESGTRAEARVITRFMVLPFRMLPADPEIGFLALSLPDAISLALAALQSVVVRSAAAAAQYAVDPPDLARIARDAHVDHVLVGTIMRAGAAIRVSTQLLTVPDGTVEWSNTWQGSLTDVFQLQDDIVKHIVESLSLQLTPRDQRTRQRDVPASANAYELYLRGNQILVQGLRGGQDLGVARDLYLRCVDEDPNFAPAWARLGRCYWLLSKGSDAPQLVLRAQECCERALELNPDLALAHNLYAQVELDLNRATEATLRLIGRIREGRGEPELYAALTHACRFCGLLEASLESHERARRLDPEIQTSVNHTYYQLGDCATALKTMGKGTVYLDALILFEQGHRDGALRLIAERERTNLLPVTRDSLGALRGWIEGRTEESIALCRRAAGQITDGESLLQVARILSALGEGGEAVLLLQRVLERGFNPYRFLRSSDGALNCARAHPAYPSLLGAARTRYESARQAFIDAGGERLLGVTIPIP